MMDNNLQLLSQYSLSVDPCLTKPIQTLVLTEPAALRITPATSPGLPTSLARNLPWLQQLWAEFSIMYLAIYTNSLCMCLLSAPASASCKAPGVSRG